MSVGYESVGRRAVYDLVAIALFAASVGWKLSKNTYWFLLLHGVWPLLIHCPLAVVFDIMQHGESKTVKPETNPKIKIKIHEY